MSDEDLRQAERSGTLTWRQLSRSGMCRVRVSGAYTRLAE